MAKSVVEFVPDELVFVREEEPAGEQAMFEGVADDDGFSLFGARAGAFEGVFTVGDDLSGGSHGLVLRGNSRLPLFRF